MGSSAALNSRLDSYWFEQDGAGWGRADSPVRFVDLWSGGAPPFSAGMEILDRKGCDRDPIDATDPRRRAHAALVRVARAARTIHARARRDRDGRGSSRSRSITPTSIDWLPAQLREPHPGAALVIFHSVFWQYLEADTQAALRSELDAAGAAATTPTRRLAWLRLEPHATNYVPAELRLTVWDGRGRRAASACSATTGFHGGPINWLEPE